MAILDDNDPICILSDQIIKTLEGHDGGTVLAALAMTLTTTMAWAANKSGCPMPPDALMLRDDLTQLTADIVRARGEQRES